MKLLVALLLAASTLNAPNGDYVRLTEEPCTTKAGVFANMPEELRPQFKAAEVKYQGKTYAACYIVQYDQVYVVDEEGDTGYINKDKFVQDVSA